MNTTQPMLSISMMTPGKKHTLEPCLKSLAHLRKTIPCQLVLTDTGCEPEQRKLLEKYGDLVLDFEWCNDFAKARNHGISHCTGEWFMVLDDDEIFERTTEIEDFFLSGEYKKYHEARVWCINYLSWDRKQHDEGMYALKMMEMGPKTRYVGKIHEVLEGINGNVAMIDALYGHYGYVYENSEQSELHSRRNIQPLEEGLAKDPDNIHFAMQLANEYYISRRVFKLEQLCRQYYDRMNHKVANEGLFAGGLYYSLVFQERFEEADELCEAITQDPYIYVGAHATVLADRAMRASKQQDMETTYAFSERYMEVYFQISKKELAGVALFFMGWGFTDEVFARVASIYLQAAIALRRGIKRQYITKFPWDAYDFVYPLWLEEKIKPDFREQLYPYIEGVDCKNSYILTLQIYAAKRRHVSDAMMQELAEKLFHSTNNVFGFEREIYVILHDYHVNCEELLQGLPMDTYVGDLKKAQQSGRSHWDEFAEHVAIIRQSEDIHYQYFDMLYAEVCLLDNTESDFEVLLQSVKHFAACAHAYYRKLFTDQAWEECVFLPEAGELARRLEAFVKAVEATDVQGAMSELRQAIGIHTKYDGMLQKLAHGYSDDLQSQKTAEPQVSQELLALAAQVKQQAIQLMQAGDYQNAVAILEQLLAIVPNDAEAQALHQQALPPILSITMITNGKKDTLEASLQSLEHLRASVPCELVVTDTGCDADARSIIERYADQLVAFDWNQDFAAARNAGLAVCRGEWFLFIDDDEVFADTREIEDFFLSGAYRSATEAKVRRRDYGNREKSVYQDVIIPRLAKLSPDTRFIHPIHEELADGTGQGTVLNDVLEHYGYIYDSKEQQQAHQQRNIFILRHALELDPEDLHYASHLTQEYLAMEDWPVLVELCERYETIAAQATEESDRAMGQIFLCGKIYGFLQEGQFETALALVETGLQQTTLSAFAQTALWAYGALAQRGLGNEAECARYQQQYRTLYDQYRQYDEYYSVLFFIKDVFADAFREKLGE